MPAPKTLTIGGRANGAALSVSSVIKYEHNAIPLDRSSYSVILKSNQPANAKRKYPIPAKNRTALTAISRYDLRGAPLNSPAANPQR